MTYILKQTLEALDILVEYPALMDYIKTFNGYGGFMYTIETDLIRKEYEQQLTDILDSNGMHSGGSWGCMMRNIQYVLNGHTTRENILQEIEVKERECREWNEQYEAIKQQIKAEDNEQ